jgi:hypothetical protein
MKKFGRAGSTFGTVVAAAIVLTIATTGGAVAGGLITSKQIKNNTIKSIDVRNGTLTGVDVADGSLGGADIADGSVGSADIADGSVGKAKIAAAAQGYTNVVTKVVTATGVPNNATSTRTVDCGAGNVAIGGGGYTEPSGLVLLGTAFGILEQSMPATPSSFALSGSVPAGDGVAPRAWRTTVRNNDGSTTSNVHYAICASK